MPWLTPSFFTRDVLTVARDLIGVELHWQGCVGIIVEVEAYAAEGDPACHTATRPRARAFVQSQPPGAAYVYLNYGVHWLFNLLVKGGAQDGLVLVRALQPVSGIDLMFERRGSRRDFDLCSGPGKLGRALGILGDDHGAPMVGPQRRAGCGLKMSPSAAHEVVSDVRVGIRQASDYPWRFLAKDNPHVSVPHGKVKPPKS